MGPEHDGASFGPWLVVCGAPLVAALLLFVIGTRVAKDAQRLLAWSGVGASFLSLGAAWFEGAPATLRAGFHWLSLSGVDEAGFLHAGVAPEVRRLAFELWAHPVGLAAGFAVVMLAVAVLALRRSAGALELAALLLVLGLLLAAVLSRGLVLPLLAVVCLSLISSLVDGTPPAIPRLSLSLAARAGDVPFLFAVLLLLQHGESTSWPDLQDIAWGLAYPAQFWDELGFGAGVLPAWLVRGNIPPANVATALFVLAFLLKLVAAERLALRRGTARPELWTLAAATSILGTCLFTHWAAIFGDTPGVRAELAFGGVVLLAIAAWPRSYAPGLALVRSLLGHTGLAWVAIAGGASHAAWINLVGVVLATAALSLLASGVGTRSPGAVLIFAALVGLPGSGLFVSRVAVWDGVARYAATAAWASSWLLPLAAAATVVGAAQLFGLVRTALRRAEGSSLGRSTSVLSWYGWCAGATGLAYVDRIVFPSASTVPDLSTLDLVDTIVPLAVIASLVLGAALGRAALLPLATVSPSGDATWLRQFDRAATTFFARGARSLRARLAMTATELRDRARRGEMLAGGMRRLDARWTFPAIVLGVVSWFGVPRADLTTSHSQSELLLQAHEGYGYRYAWTVRRPGQPELEASGAALNVPLGPGETAEVELAVVNGWGWRATETATVIQPKPDGSAPGETLQLELSEDGKLRRRGTPQ